MDRDLFDFGNPFENADLLRSELSDEFKIRSLKEIDELLRNSGVTYGVLGRTTDHREDLQFLETETLVPLDHGSFDKLYTVNSPFHIQGEKKINFSRAPKIGEHTKQVLELLGYGESELEKLKKENSIYWPEK